MAVLSVDLASRRWSDLGIAVLERVHPSTGLVSAQPLTHCELISWEGYDLNPDSVLTPQLLAGRLNHLAATRGIRMILLDGPQAWKSRLNGLEHARRSERQLNTPTKTGLPGQVKPHSLRSFAEFCVDVWAELCLRGWRRLATCEHPDSTAQRVLAESYPHAAWRSLGLHPLPSKRHAHISDLAEAYGDLQKVQPFTVNRPPNHDQLQAIVGGLAGLSLEAREGARIVGAPPCREEGQWREGYIVLPLPPDSQRALRWISTRFPPKQPEKSSIH